MEAYSLDLRVRVMKAYDEGHWSVGQLSERFKVGEWWIHKLKRQRRQEGSLAVRKGKVGQPRSLQDKQIGMLEKYVDGHPDATLEEIREHLGLSCTVVTIHHTLRRLGYRYKKTLRASEQDRADLREKRGLWREAQKAWPAERLVFLDESCAKTNLTRLRGRARKGHRLHDHAPGGQWHTTTMLGSIRLNGQTACLVIEGAANALIFREYIRQVLGPTLQPGDLVICDNLSAHRDQSARQLIEERGAQLLFLPAYSPDLNPIEMMWAKVKQHLRSAKARSQHALLTAIRDALASVSSADAHGFFHHAGYMCTIT